MRPNSPLVSTEWLGQHIDAPDVRVADASWYLPQAGRNARQEYESAHIPRAVFFDIDDLSDEKSPLPHMLAPAPKFASRMRKLGLGDGNLIVVYDGGGIHSSPRAWWMLRAMGHEDVVVLDGGIPKWRAEGRPVEDLIPNSYPRHFSPRPNNAILRSFDQVKDNLQSRAEQVIDARGSGRFNAKEPEPRPGLRGGHIPRSRNLPYTELFAANGTLKPREDLVALFKAHDIDPAKPSITSCGSGITAAIVSLALAVVGAKNSALYDGSWAEWGSRADAAIEA